jgi:hypothetical protein
MRTTNQVFVTFSFLRRKNARDFGCSNDVQNYIFLTGSNKNLLHAFYVPKMTNSYAEGFVNLL